MRTSLVSAKFLIAALAVAVMPGASRADIDPPHDQAKAQIACYYCHSMAVRTGTSGANFNTACLACHNQGTAFGAPWGPEDEAVPGVTGTSHNWSGPGTNPQYGAVTHLGFIKYYNWAGGNLQCIVCHEVHKQAPSTPASVHTSLPVGVAIPRTGTTGTGGTASMVLTVNPGAGSNGFRIKILTQDATGGTFIVSHEYGWNQDLWIVRDAGDTTWVAGTAAGPGRRFNYGATSAFDVPLDVGGVSVRFDKGATGATVGDYWDFYVGYPLLRYTNSDDGICVGCHRERVMNHVRARGLDRDYAPDGNRKFSHPVGVGLNVTSLYTDRATILDADGTVGTSTTDGLSGSTPVRNDTNNMNLGTGNVLRCTTCHSVHNTDSNSLTVDVR